MFTNLETVSDIARTLNMTRPNVYKLLYKNFNKIEIKKIKKDRIHRNRIGRYQRRINKLNMGYNN